MRAGKIEGKGVSELGPQGNVRGGCLPFSE